ncbi:MAG: DinB family protein [Candidatus Hydrogenedentes bacterium]|nr:DinB family protein [Candidatus Hydrogenedentota bacterium]
MGKERIEVFANIYKAAAKSLKETAEKVAEETRLHQIAEGKGHPLWQMGHLSWAHDFIINQWFLGGESVISAEYSAVFAPEVMKGKTPTAKASDYPSWDEVMESYDKACARTIELIEGLSDEDLPGGLRGDVSERARSHFGNMGEALMMMSLHDAHHRGQIALIDAL